jgi:hypothetical protein
MPKTQILAQQMSKNLPKAQSKQSLCPVFQDGVLMTLENCLAFMFPDYIK